MEKWNLKGSQPLFSADSPSLLLNTAFPVGEMAQWVKLFPHQHEDRVLTPRSSESQMGVHIYNSSSPAGAWKMKAEEFPAASRPVSLCTQWKTTEILSYTKWKAETATQSCTLTSTPHQSIHMLEFTHKHMRVFKYTWKFIFLWNVWKTNPWSNNCG